MKTFNQYFIFVLFCFHSHTVHLKHPTASTFILIPPLFFLFEKLEVVPENVAFVKCKRKIWQLSSRLALTS